MGRMVDASSVSSPPPLAMVSCAARQNVTFAINYSSPEMAKLYKSYRKSNSNNSIPNNHNNASTNKNEPTNMENTCSSSWLNRDFSQEKIRESASMTKVSFETLDEKSSKPQREERRTSNRQVKARNNKEKNRVKYDMNLVPGARRNRAFVQHFGSKWHTTMNTTTTEQANHTKIPIAFLDKASVVWIPGQRSEWEDCVSEMTAVCTSAAARRYSSDKDHTPKPFYAPLSKDYIRDRVDIDDPLAGYQIRHRGGGWLQGFVLWTNFTTWTHYFKWDSLHPQSGIAETRHPKDANGALSAELEGQVRSGDPLGGGVVFETMAEISLLGGLGCGEYLLRMALDDIVSRGRYKYVILQATDTSRAFYERFGFVRVGAVSTYGTKQEEETACGVEQSKRVVGYRHWTYAHETSHSLDMHGGPSYMMALVLPNDCGKPTFLAELMKLQVTQKPKIMQLGGTCTPAKSKKPRDLSFNTTTTTAPSRKRTSADWNKTFSTNKRSRFNHSVQEAPQRKVLMTPPPPGKTLTYAQKQYQSVWLAVPPSNPAVPRKPPRRRDSKQKDKTTSVSTSRSKSPKKPTRLVEKRREPTTTSTIVPPSNRNDKTLRKQKVLTIHRDPSKIYYYNKVVKRKGTCGTYYFVLHYDEILGTIQILPLEQQGTLVGKRLGRPRYKAITANHANAPVVSILDHDIVPAYMVTKTPIVWNETWDVLV